ncbi:MAG: hypothetical protein QXU32_01715 [Nitrososphaerales archaeon]
MGIRSTYNKQGLIRIAGNPKTPPPSFYATGKGLAVNQPDITLGPQNANASLEIVSAPEIPGASHLRKIYLLVTGVSTNWSISGTYGQSELSRSWYPRNLTQGDFIINGVTINQHHYDLLVEFVQNHHRTLLEGVYDRIDSEIGMYVPSVTFTMWSNKYAKSINAMVPSEIFDPVDPTRLRIELVISSIQAGHERFRFAPEYQLNCKVINDKLSSDASVETEIADMLDYEEIFGKGIQITPTGQEFDGDVPSTTKQYKPRKVRNSTGQTAILGRGSFLYSSGADAHSRAQGQWEPGTPPAKWKDAIAAQAPPLSDPDKLKARFPNWEPPNKSACVPPWDGTRQYFGEIKDEGRIFGKGYDQTGTVDSGCKDKDPHIHVKYRNPPNAGNTIPVFVNP